ncbi:MAG TPA: VWA domain-containing protein [Terriglobales bacterium]|nr:VWA domain-containing protein [Terriglobales bacterium]
MAQQQVPDAPSATKPANPFPAGTKPAPIEQPNRPETTSEKSEPSQPQQNEPPATTQAGPPKAVHDPAAEDSGRDELPRFTSTTNFVTVPVTVLDNDGRAVLGLMKRDFAIFEDDKQMDLKFFTSDPFPLSAAVIVDQGMADVSLRKVNASLDALAGAFAPYDEVALYTYSNTVQARADWQAAGDQFTMAVKKSKSSGRTGGVPVVSGPLAGGPPSINGQRVDPGYPRVNTPVRESHVLNDAIVRAANDLAHRDKSRRRMIFIISDGAEDGSSSSYQDTLKLLLTNNIAVFALGVDSAAVPVYEKLARIRIPRFGTGNILPKYVSATGGQLITEFSRDAIERAYAELTGQARNQYTLGYTTNFTPSSTYRSIEVRVRRPNVRVYAKDGYYPLPSRR